MTIAISLGAPTPRPPTRGRGRDRWRLGSSATLSLLAHAAVLAAALIAARRPLHAPEWLPPPAFDVIFEGGGAKPSAVPNPAPAKPKQPASPATEQASPPPSPTPAPAVPETPPPPPLSRMAPERLPEPFPPVPTQPAPAQPAPETPPPPPLSRMAPEHLPEPFPPVPAAPSPAQPAPTTPPPPLPRVAPEPLPPTPAAPAETRAAPPALPSPAPAVPAPPHPAEALPVPPQPPAARPPVPRPQPAAPAFPAPMNFSFGPTPRLPSPAHPRAGRGAIDLSFAPPNGGAASLQIYGRHDSKTVGADWYNEFAAWWARHGYYPPQAGEKGESGDVTVDLVVRRDGQVRTVALSDRSGSTWLDMAAIAVFRDARLPPLPSDVADTVPLTVTIHYVIVRR